MKMKIVTYPSKTLNTKAEEIWFDECNIEELYDSMVLLIEGNNAVGLAAPQVGLSYRFIVVKVKDVFIGMINPEIIDFTVERIVEMEGCLSIPGERIQVPRHKLIFVKYIDIHGKKQEQWACEEVSRIIQHEIDHLDGKTLLDYINRKERRHIISKLMKRKRKYGN